MFESGLRPTFTPDVSDKNILNKQVICITLIGLIDFVGRRVSEIGENIQ
jgi:hypothetical protein